MLIRRREAETTQDGGFTLIELLISVAILGVVMGGVAMAMLVSLNTNNLTKTRLANSLDLQFATSYFADDVAGANTVAVQSAPHCGTDPAAKVAVELTGSSFTWSGSTPQAQTVVITYALRTKIVNGASVGELHRVRCDGATTTDTTVARNLNTSTPGVTCLPGGTAAACSASGWTTVRIGLSSQTPDLSGTLTAHRRSSS